MRLRRSTERRVHHFIATMFSDRALANTQTRTGLGRLLMAFQERIARHTPTISKVMLTCFTRNNDAFEFYKKLGFDIDPISPVPRKLRFGKESPPDYVIMSKTVD